MVKPKNQIITWFSFLVLLHSLSIPTSSQEVDDESEFNYIEGSKKGPENWGNLNPNWTLCRDGKLQSPIDLTKVKEVGSLGRLQTYYKPSFSTLTNRGHDVMLSWVKEAGSLYIDGTEYKLKQCHWHSPSEHSINGRRGALEVHMVHQSSDNRIAVIAILYSIGHPDPFLSKLERYVEAISRSHQKEIEVGVTDPNLLTMGGIFEYYRYMGSLTTPPCTEGVVWTVAKQVRTASCHQVNLLREAVHDGAKNNARPLQKINDRPIYLYRPLCAVDDALHISY